jgi:hypothetical protein
VNRRLTLTLGLRYEIQLPRTTRYNRQNWFDFGIRNPISDDVGMDLRGGLVFASPSERGQTELDHWNMAPRLGFAYKVTDRLVMRGGYGISYMRSNGKGGVTGNQGYSVTSQWVPSVGGDGINPLNLLSNPFPNGFDQPTGASLGALTQIGRNVRAFNHNNPSPYLQSYSLDFQYELTQGSVFEIGYTGNVGRKLNYGYNPNWNQMHPSFLSLGESLNDPVANPFSGVITSGALRGETVPRHRLLRAHPQFLNVSAPRDEKGANSSFNALYLKYTQRFSRGLTILASYQWSKALDNASEDQGWFVGDVPRNVFDFGSEWSLSAHDVPHDVATSFIWEVPVGKGRAHGGGHEQHYGRHCGRLANIRYDALLEWNSYQLEGDQHARRLWIRHPAAEHHELRGAGVGRAHAGAVVQQGRRVFAGEIRDRQRSSLPSGGAQSWAAEPGFCAD